MVFYNPAPTEQDSTEVSAISSIAAYLFPSPSFVRMVRQPHGYDRPQLSSWTCNGLVPVTCLSLCHLSFESQGAYAAQI
jgi:hypothetical protein